MAAKTEHKSFNKPSMRVNFNETELREQKLQIMATKNYHRDIPLAGKWITRDPATIGNNFQTLDNLRYVGGNAQVRCRRYDEDQYRHYECDVFQDAKPVSLQEITTGGKPCSCSGIQYGADCISGFREYHGNPFGGGVFGDCIMDGFGGCRSGKIL